MKQNFVCFVQPMCSINFKKVFFGVREVDSVDGGLAAQALGPELESQNHVSWVQQRTSVTPDVMGDGRQRQENLYRCVA